MTNAFREVVGALHISTLKRLLDLHDLHVGDRRARAPMERAIIRHYSHLTGLVNDLEGDEVEEIIDCFQWDEAVTPELIRAFRENGLWVEAADEEEAENQLSEVASPSARN